jgi:multisubunit Na+/H+ antiporter MnhB subunit
MRRVFLAIGVTTWVFVGTLFLSRWWYANPDFFPRFPDAFWKRIDQLFGVTNVDDASNVELATVVFLALIVVLVATVIVVMIYRHLKRKN